MRERRWLSGGDLCSHYGIFLWSVNAFLWSIQQSELCIAYEVYGKVSCVLLVEYTAK